ncbi:MAG: folate-binding protein YgfZ [Gammaproteobacteria bacterium]|nr:folate-binding protein YgfZ [Gammaproteobacteria bacterium]
MNINNNWLDFLKQQNAHIKNNVVEHFGNKDVKTAPPSLHQTILCDLSHMGFISADGAEAQLFLQNQLSNNINNVSVNHSQLNAYCSAKGRVLALFQVLQHQDKYILFLPKECLDATLKRLQMYVLMTKVTLQDASNELVAIGLAGNDANVELKKYLPTIPENPDDVTQYDGLSVTKVQGQSARFIIIGHTDKIVALWRQLQMNTTLCSHHAWSHLDILSGIPQVYQQNVEAFVPQMLNLHSIDGVSFQKGCYPGQEVVARMHFLGKLKRRMYLAHVDNNALLPTPGTPLFADNDKSDQGVGKVVDAQISPDGGIDMLAVLQITSAENGTIHLKDKQGTTLNLKDLPYTVELEREGKKP